VKHFAAFALLLAASCAASPSTPTAPVAPHVVLEGGDTPEFAADADAILAELEAWRGLRFREDLVVSIVPQSEVEDERLNGWYESSTKRLVVVEGKTDRMSRGTLLHEMFHALQDQHFDLARLHAEADPLGEDARRALRALIEGEAMLAVSELMNYDFEQHAHLPETGPIDVERFEKIFHYGAGLRYARALREAGGWERVDAAFADPPRTTAEVLHLERLEPGYVASSETPELPPSDDAAFPRGQYAVALFLAKPEATRARSAEAAMHVLAEEAWTERGELVWRLLFDEADAARLAIEAAKAQGGRTLSAIGEHGGLVTLYLPSL